jgi:hypothetical protein
MPETVVEQDVTKLFRDDCQLLSISAVGYRVSDLPVKFARIIDKQDFYQLVLELDNLPVKTVQAWVKAYSKFGQTKDLKVITSIGTIMIPSPVCIRAINRTMNFCWLKLT